MQDRDYTAGDRLVMNLDQAVRTLLGRPQTTERPNPADDLPEAELSEAQRDHIARLMRINHTGEVCAQGLYQGQALTARDPATRDSMQRSAAEENDHLGHASSSSHQPMNPNLPPCAQNTVHHQHTPEQ